MTDLYELYNDAKKKIEYESSSSSSDNLFELSQKSNSNRNKNSDIENDMSLFNEFRTFKKNVYEQSKVERKNKCELLLPKNQPKLFKIHAEKAKEYTQILKTLNVYDNILNKKPDFDFTYFELDKAGCDSRIIDILPEYLDKHIIIASAHQKNMDILRNNYSFLEPMLNEILDGRAKETIAAITPYEILFGKLNTGLETLVKQINFGARHLVESGYFEISLELDTYTDSIKKMVNLRNKVLDIMDLEKQGVSSILNYGLEDEILSISRDLNKKYIDTSRFVLGDGDFIIDDIFPLKIKTNSYKYKNEDIDIYSFKNGKYIFVYFELGEQQVSKTFIDEKNYLVINGNDPSMMLLKLHENNIIDFNLSPKYIKDKLIEVEQKDFSKYSKENDNIILKTSQAKKANYHSPLFYELESSLKEIESTEIKNEKEYMKNKSVEFKLSLMYPVIQDRLVYELLAKVNKNENTMTYTWDSENFKTKFSSETDENRSLILKEVLEGIKYEEQYNLQVNKWLFDNYKTLCEKSGVEFKAR
jgi:hypothetical protein